MLLRALSKSHINKKFILCMGAAVSRKVMCTEIQTSKGCIK